MKLEQTREWLQIFNWVVIGFFILQPILRQRMLDAGRQVALQAIEKNRKSRVISLIHRKETVNILGFPLVQYLDIQDSEAILRAIRLTPPELPIDMILHTPAGLSLAAEQIARAVFRHKAKVTVIIPHYAMSGGTLIAIAADEIIMSPDAILGALDPSIDNLPAASVMSVGERKTPEQMDDRTFVLVDRARKAINQMKQIVNSLLAKRMPPEDAARLAEKFTSGSFTQDYPISADEVKEMGLNVTLEVPVEILQYMNLFPQADQQRPTVDYIPMPYPPVDKGAAQR